MVPQCVSGQSPTDRNQSILLLATVIMVPQRCAQMGHSYPKKYFEIAAQEINLPLSVSFGQEEFDTSTV